MKTNKKTDIDKWLRKAKKSKDRNYSFETGSGTSVDLLY